MNRELSRFDSPSEYRVDINSRLLIVSDNADAISVRKVSVFALMDQEALEDLYGSRGCSILEPYGRDKIWSRKTSQTGAIVSLFFSTGFR